MLKSINLSFQYSGSTPIRFPDFTAEQGDQWLILGPSGSGKTTLLNMIGGLDIPSEGFVEINGTNITELKDNKLIDFRLNNIGFVFQSYNLIPVLTAKENIEFIMLLQNRKLRERGELLLQQQHKLKCLQQALRKHLFKILD